jgi:HSP20 family molecular chaperone IbpA
MNSVFEDFFGRSSSDLWGSTEELTIKGEKKVEKEEEEGDYYYSERNYGHFERTIAAAAGDRHR